MTVYLLRVPEVSLLLTMVVSAMEPKLLMKMLQETLTAGPAEREATMRRMQHKKEDICFILMLIPPSPPLVGLQE